MKNSKRHIPQRTCIECRSVNDKRQLLRFVRIPDGSIQIDYSGKLSGRGAYLCTECRVAGIRGNRLDYAMRTRITEENKEDLIRAIDKL